MIDTARVPEAVLKAWMRRECGQILGMSWPDEATIDSTHEWMDEPQGMRVWAILMRVERTPQLEAALYLKHLPASEQTAAVGRWLSMLAEYRATEVAGPECIALQLEEA